MNIPNLLKNKRTISFEFFPPKTEDKIDELYTTVKNIIKYKPDFVSVTDSGIWGKTKHIALSMILKEKFNLNVMVHLTCINNTNQEINNAIKEIDRHGIRNVLALKGDINTQIKLPEFFINSLDLLPKIPPHISKGIALYPQSHPDTSTQREIELIKKKIELGAEFGITQLFLDIKTFEKMLEKLKKNKINIPVIAGILPITSKDVFHNIISKVKKISIPKNYIKIIEKYSDYSKKQDFFNASIDFISKIVEQILKIEIAGIHFFTLNKNKGVEEIIKRTKICNKLN